MTWLNKKVYSKFRNIGTNWFTEVYFFFKFFKFIESRVLLSKTSFLRIV